MTIDTNALFNRLDSNHDFHIDMNDNTLTDDVLAKLDTAGTTTLSGPTVSAQELADGFDKASKLPGAATSIKKMEKALKQEALAVEKAHDAPPASADDTVNSTGALCGVVGGVVAGGVVGTLVGLATTTGLGLAIIGGIAAGAVAFLVGFVIVYAAVVLLWRAFENGAATDAEQKKAQTNEIVETEVTRMLKKLPTPVQTLKPPGNVGVSPQQA